MFFACFWAVPLNFKNDAEWHRAFVFVIFVAVSLNFKSGVPLHQKW